VNTRRGRTPTCWKYLTLAWLLLAMVHICDAGLQNEDETVFDLGASPIPATNSTAKKVILEPDGTAKATSVTADKAGAMADQIATSIVDAHMSAFAVASNKQDEGKDDPAVNIVNAALSKFANAKINKSKHTAEKNAKLARQAKENTSKVKEKVVKEKKQKAADLRDQIDEKALKKSRARRLKDEAKLFISAADARVEQSQQAQVVAKQAVVSQKLKQELKLKLAAKAKRREETVEERKSREESAQAELKRQQAKVRAVEKRLRDAKKREARRERAADRVKKDVSQEKESLKGNTEQRLTSVEQRADSVEHKQENAQRKEETLQKQQSEISGKQSAQKASLEAAMRKGVKKVIEREQARLSQLAQEKRDVAASLQTAKVKATNLANKVGAIEGKEKTLTGQEDRQRLVETKLRADARNVNMRKDRVQNAKRSVHHLQRKLERREKAVRRKKNKVDTRKERMRDIKERTASVEKKEAEVAGSEKMLEREAQQAKQAAKKAIEKAAKAGEVARKMAYKTVVANPKKYSAFDAIEKAKKSAATAAAAVASARSAVASEVQGRQTTEAAKEMKKDAKAAVAQGTASQLAADKVNKMVLDNALKVQKATTKQARFEAMVAVKKAAAAQAAAKVTGSKATKAIAAAQDAGLAAKHALQKLFAVGNGGKLLKRKAPNQHPTAPVALKSDAKRWADMEKRAAENAMKAIASNVKAVQAEQSERKIAGTAIRRARRSETHLASVQAHEKVSKSRLIHAKWNLERRRAELERSQRKEQRLRSLTAPAHEVRSAVNSARATIQDEEKKINDLSKSKANAVTVAADKLKLATANDKLQTARASKIRIEDAQKRLQVASRTTQRRQLRVEHAKAAWLDSQKKAEHRTGQLYKAKKVAKDSRLALAQSRAKADQIHASLMTGAAMSAIKIAAKAARQEAAAVAHAKVDHSENSMSQLKIATAKANHAAVNAKVDITQAKSAELMVKKSQRAAQETMQEVVDKADAKNAAVVAKNSEKEAKRAKRRRDDAQERNAKSIENAIDAAAEAVHSPTYVKVAAAAMAKATQQVKVANNAAIKARMAKEQASKNAKLDMGRAQAVLAKAKAQAEAAKREMQIATEAMHDNKRASETVSEATKRQQKAIKAVATAEHESVAAAAVVEAVGATDKKLEQLHQQSKTLVHASNQEKAAASVEMKAMHRTIKQSLQKQLEANDRVKKAAHELQVKKLSVELRREQLQAKTVSYKVASDALDSAKVGVLAATKEAAAKHSRLEMWMQHKVRAATGSAIQAHAAGSASGSAKVSTQEIRSKFEVKDLALAKQKSANVAAAAATVKVAAAKQILADKERQRVKSEMLSAISSSQRASTKLGTDIKALRETKAFFKKESARMIASAVDAARKQTANAAESVEATEEAKALGKAAVEKIVRDVETGNVAKSAQTEADEAKEKEVKARAKWEYATGLVAKSQQTVASMNEERVVLGTKLVSTLKLEGAVIAAKAAVKEADKLEAKYRVAESHYAQKAAVAEAATAVHDSDATILPTNANMTQAVRVQAARTVKQLRQLYTNSVKGLNKDVTLYQHQKNATHSLRESLDLATKKTRHASYEHKYAASLQKALIAERLTRATAKQHVIHSAVEKEKQLVTAYQHEKTEMELQEMGSAPTVQATKVQNQNSKSSTIPLSKLATAPTAHSSILSSPQRAKSTVPHTSVPAKQSTFKTLLGDVHVDARTSHHRADPATKLENSEQKEPLANQQSWYHTMQGQMSKPKDDTDHPWFKTIIGGSFSTPLE